MYPYCSKAVGIKSGPELGQNWAVWPIVAVTARRQIEQCVAHRMEGVSLLAKVGRARFRQRLDLRTGATAIGPQTKQLSDFLDRKAAIAGIGYEAQPMDVHIAIIAIATVPPRRRREQPDFLLMATHPQHGRSSCRESWGQYA